MSHGEAKRVDMAAKAHFYGDSLMLTELPESEIDNNLKTLTSKVNTNEHIGASGIGFRDVKYALEPSEGHFGSDANEWLANFENVATASCWNDVQKYLFARRLLQKNCKSGSRIGMKCIILVLFSKIKKKKLGKLFVQKMCTKNYQMKKKTT